MGGCKASLQVLGQQLGALPGTGLLGWTSCLQFVSAGAHNQSSSSCFLWLPCSVINCPRFYPGVKIVKVWGSVTLRWSSSWEAVSSQQDEAQGCVVSR